MVNDKVAEAEWKYTDVNEHWQQMKNIMMIQHRSHLDCQKAHAGIRKHGGGMSKVMKSFICRGCVIPVTGTGRTSVDTGGDSNL